VYSVKLIVTDDDGASDTWVAQVIVTNLPPTIQPFGPYDVYETDPLSVAATATDPGSDDLTFTWTFDYGPTIQNTYYNDGVSPDPVKSPDGTFPFTAGDFASHTYGDDGVFTIILIVEDDDGALAAYRTVVTVHNVPPTIVGARAFVVANITMRIAGEKWHDVIMRLYEDGNEIGYARLVRYPGSPNDQMATIHGVEINLEKQFSVVVYYTPDDDPVNGQPNGANPFWLIFEWEDSGETRLHHTFNVQHPETWIWKVDNVYIHALGHEIHLQGSATDPGSDDLIFVWDTGDGRAFRTIAFNDGVGPDRYPSPDINPMSASSEVTLVYSVAGTYTITLTVFDDDGGSSMYSFTIKIG